MTTLDAQAIELIGLAKRLIALSKGERGQHYVTTAELDLSQGYLEARAEIERLRDVAARLERHVAIKAFDTFAGKDRWKSDALIALLEETQTALHPQPDTTSEVM